MVVVLFWTFVYDVDIYYKTWIYQCLIKQVKSPSICSRVPETGSDPPIGSSRESGRDNRSIIRVCPRNRGAVSFNIRS